MALSASKLATDMGTALLGSLKKSIPDIQEYAKTEAKKLAQTLVMIEKLSLTGKIDKEEAKLHLEIQQNATRTVLLTLKGLGVLAAEQAINAALSVVKKAVNTSLGFALI